MIDFKENHPIDDDLPEGIPEAVVDAIKERGDIKRGMKGTLEAGTPLYVNGKDVIIDHPVRVEIIAVDYNEYRVRFLDEGGVNGFHVAWLIRKEGKHFKADDTN